jgi:molybdopterin converting factor small subunit
MHVDVLYFASLRERRGRPSERIETPTGTTVADLFASLFPDDPPTVAFTVDRRVCPGDTVLHDGAEVSFLPPLGGG